MEPISTTSLSETDGGDENKCTEPGKTGRSFDLSMRQYPCAKMKLDQFFLEWLSLPEYERLIAKVLENAANNRPLRYGVEEAMSAAQTTDGVYNPQLNAPPMSPKASVLENKQEELGSFLNKPKSAGEGLFQDHHHRTMTTTTGVSIPQFYFPEGTPASLELKKASHQKISELFSLFQPMGMQQKDFLKVLGEICELPEMLAYPLFKKLTDNSLLTQEVFENWWDSESLASASAPYRMLCILRKDSSVQWLSREDFIPLLRSIVDYHPSLEFLSEHPEFQERYIETVSYRIMYSVNKSGNGKISLRELKRSDFIDALFELDTEMDINRVLRYFSYEHFYVIYCKFWELDTDHDFFLERHDLLRYGSHCLTYQIVDRIFDVQISQKQGLDEGKMDYRDFIWFILSEEDKTTDTSLDYWLHCVDLDCDGVLSCYDLRPFYEAQVERMENTSCETVSFEDILCQLHDLIRPKCEGCFSIYDLRRDREGASVLFNTLFNLHKFLLFEQHDPSAVRTEQECMLTDWDKFAAVEYDILSAEEDQDGSNRDDSNALAGEIQQGY
eukprot:g4711.t1